MRFINTKRGIFNTPHISNPGNGELRCACHAGGSSLFSLSRFLFTLIPFAFLSLGFISCARGTYPVVSKVLSVPLPPLSDSVYVTYKTDSLVVGTHAHLADTVVRIEYLPAVNRFFYRIKRDTVLVPVSDTVFLKSTIQPEGEGVGWYVYFGAGGLVVLMLFMGLTFRRTA